MENRSKHKEDMKFLKFVAKAGSKVCRGSGRLSSGNVWYTLRQALLQTSATCTVVCERSRFRVLVAMARLAPALKHEECSMSKHSHTRAGDQGLRWNPRGRHTTTESRLACRTGEDRIARIASCLSNRGLSNQVACRTCFEKPI